MKGGRLTELITSFHAYLSIIYILTPPISASPIEDQEGGANLINYGVLLDAGSSSTKLKVYRWDSSASYSLMPRLDLITNDRFQTGLSDYEHDPGGLNLYVQKIVSKAKQDVPSSKYSETPIFLMATAGLRFLSAADANIFLEKTKSVMANKTMNPFLYTPSNIRILSGEVEGVYSWIAANYLMGFFDRHRPDNESTGVLEMGGGSTQIAFIPSGPIFSEEYKVVVAGRPFQLYVQSYLQFGSNSIKLKVAHELGQRHPGQDEVDHPCMLRGDKRRSRLDHGVFVTEKGTGSPALCLEILREILKPSTGIDCQPKPCAIGSVYQPSVAGMKFVAIQAFTYTPATLKVVGNDEVLHIDRLEEAAVRHCNRSLNQAVNESGISVAFASDDCLMGLYIPTLLTTSYGFGRNTTNIKLTSGIGENKIDWSLGAMLVELSNSFGSSRSHFAVTCKSEAEFVKGSNLSLSLHSWMSQLILLPVSLLVILFNNLGLNIFH